MKEQEILERLPLHVDSDKGGSIADLLKKRRILAVITEGENGANLYPGPKYANA